MGYNGALHNRSCQKLLHCTKGSAQLASSFLEISSLKSDGTERPERADANGIGFGPIAFVFLAMGRSSDLLAPLLARPEGQQQAQNTRAA